MTPVGNSFSHRVEMPLSARLLEQGKVEQGASNSFADLLMSGVTQVNGLQQDANAQVHDMLTGGDVSQVEVLTAVQKSDMAFRMLVQVRNKLMAAYDEINAIRI